MKKLILTTVLIALGIVTIQAQKKGGQKPNFTTEQKATLKLKQMILLLEIDKSQQDKIYPLLLSEVKQKEKNIEALKTFRESGTKPTNEEVYNALIAKIDKQIAYNTHVKKILDDDQYEKWLEMQMKERNNMKERMMHHKRGGQKDLRENS